LSEDIEAGKTGRKTKKMSEEKKCEYDKYKCDFCGKVEISTGFIPAVCGLKMCSDCYVDNYAQARKIAGDKFPKINFFKGVTK